MAPRFRQILCLMLVLSSLFSPVCALSVCAQAERESSVIVTNIGIQPSDYKKMVASKSENHFYVNVSTDDGPARRAKIHIRGSASKEIGFASPVKRLPIELKLTEATGFSDQIANTCIKFNGLPVPCQLLAQYLAYEMFAFLDIPTPAHTFAFIQYNDIDFGLYHAIEDINQDFLKKHFSAPFGSLYKGDDTEEGNYISTDYWFGGLKVREDHGSERIDALLDALNSGQGYENYLNVDEVLRFFACTAAYGGYNSILTELTSFFLYDDNGKFILIPWDNSDAFMAEETENGIDHFRLDFWDDAPPAKLFDLLMQDPKNLEVYHGYIREINDRFLAPETIDPLVQSIAALITPYLLRDHTIFLNTSGSLPVVPEETYGSLGSFLYAMHRFHENLEAQLNGSEDRFPVLVSLPPEEQFDELIEYLVQVSPTLELDITKKICVGYTAYCRKRGITHFATGDPAEAAAAFVLFAIVFGTVLICVWKPSERFGHRIRSAR